MAGYTAKKSFAQLIHAIQDRAGNIIEDATFTMKHLDGTTVATAKNVMGNANGTAGGTNPAFSDFDGYPTPYYRHGDYIAEWTAFGDTTSRVIRIAPLFEDFALVDVTKYDGVDPTGVLDSTAAINQAIIESAGKFRVFFPPGDYRIGTGGANKVAMLSGTHLLGAGPGLSRIFADGSCTGSMIAHDGDIDGAIIEGLCVDGGGTTRDAINPNVKVTAGSTRCHLRNCWIINAPVTTTHGAIHAMWQASNSSVTNCVIGGAGIDGLWCANADKLIIANNLIYDCGDDGISCWGLTRSTIVGNVLVNENATAGGRINGRGIVLGASEKCVVNGNYVEGWERACIGIDQAGPTVYNQVTGNVCVLAGRISDSGVLGSGLLIRAFDNESGAHNNFVGNLVMDPREHGFRLEIAEATAYIEDINIESNYFVDTGTNPNSSGVGIGISAVIDSGVTSKIQRINISNNYVKGFDKEGIHIAGRSTNKIKDVNVDGNRIYDSGDFVGGDAYGMKLDWLENFTVRNNKGADVDPITQTQMGLWMNNPSGSAIITGNDFVNSKTNIISVSNFHNLAYLTFSNNIGVVPFSGRVAVATGSPWTLISGSVYKKSQTISWGNGFTINAAALLPRINVTLSVPGWTAAVTSITNSNFVIDVVSHVGDPGSGAAGTIHWDAKF